MSKPITDAEAKLLDELSDDFLEWAQEYWDKSIDRDETM